MTIRKGEEWGTVAVPEPGIQLIGSDRELRAAVVAGRSTGARQATFGLLGGDLMRTLGGRGDSSRFTTGEPIPHLPVDIVHLVVDDDRETWFVAHLVARRSWWRGSVTAVMNAQFLSVGSGPPWDVAPRSHPNDGKVDIVTATAELSLQQRWMARPRLRLGTHVPHPSITVRQQTSSTIEFDRDMPLRIDGESWGRGRRLDLRVEPDAMTVCV